MNFGYTSLKQAWQNDTRVGNWKGRSVFAAPSYKVEDLPTSHFYIIFDDGNKMYYDGLVYGTVTEAGNVEELRVPQRWNYKKRRETTPAKEEPVREKETQKEETPEVEVVVDVKINIDVDATLKLARETSVEDLLNGFNYGL